MEPGQRRAIACRSATVSLAGVVAITVASAWSLTAAVRDDLLRVPLAPFAVTLAVPLAVVGYGIVQVRRGCLASGLAVLATVAAASLQAVPDHVGTASREWLPLLAVGGLAAVLLGGTMAAVALAHVAAPRWRRGSPRRLLLGVGGGALLAAGMVLPQAVPSTGGPTTAGLGSLLQADPLLLASLAIGVTVHLVAGVVVGWVVPRRLGAAVAGTLAVLTGGALTANALANADGGLAIGPGWIVGLAGAVLFVLVRPDEDGPDQVNSSSA